ncbi:MAG: tyrosine-type recombinase/integrase [Pseudomonadota bacterium]
MERTPPYLDPKPNSNGYYVIKWAEKAPDASGWTTRRVSTRTKDREIAKSVFAGFVAEGGVDDTQPSGVERTVTQLIDWYLETWAVPRGIEKTQRWNLNAIQQHMGDLLPRSISDRTVSRFIAHRTGQDGVRTNTVRRELGALKAVLNRAVKKGVLPLKDNVSIDMPAEQEGRTGQYAWLTEIQEQEFLADMRAWVDAVPRETDAWFLRRAGELFARIGLETGARRGAICELTTDRVDLTGCVLDFRRPGQRKTRKRRAAAPITEKLRDRVSETMMSEQHARIFGRNLVGRKGADAYDEFRNEWADGKWSYVSAHILRHTCATLILRAGVQPWDVAGILADDVKTVLKTYGHHCADHLRASVGARKAVR